MRAAGVRAGRDRRDRHRLHEGQRHATPGEGESSDHGQDEGGRQGPAGAAAQDGWRSFEVATRVVTPAAVDPMLEIVSLSLPVRSKKTHLIEGPPAAAAAELVTRLREEARAL